MKIVVLKNAKLSINPVVVMASSRCGRHGVNASSMHFSAMECGINL
jgi:hypothetical protein